MRNLALSILITVGLSFLLVGCDTPPLEMTTGGVRVDDVVKRVKCELADAVDYAVTQKKLAWLEKWTTRIDLTLQLEAEGGFSPSATYVQSFHNAYNEAAGPTTLGSTTIGSIARTFSLSGGLNLNGQATRTDVLSFALSFDELRDWRKRERDQAQQKGLPDPCLSASGTGVLSDLGLRDWIAESLEPVAEGDLTAGDNPTPTYTKPAGSKAAAAAPAPKFVALINWDRVKDHVEAIEKQLAAASKASMQAQASVTKAKKLVGPYGDILSPGYEVRLDKVIQNASKQSNYAEGERDFVKMAICRAVGSVNSGVPQKYTQEYHDCSGSPDKVLLCHDGQSLPKTFTEADYPIAVTCATDAANQAQLDAQKAATDASSISKPDAPIIGVSQSVNFVVTFGGSVTPTWMLTVWRGPTAALSAMGIRTHTLDIAIGPRPPNGQKTSDEQMMSIQTLQTNRLISTFQSNSVP